MDLIEKIHYANNLFREKSYKDALLLYVEISQEEPDVPVYLNNIATILFATDRHDKAIEYYYKALEKGLSNTEIYCSLGICLDKVGRLDEAISAFSDAILCHSGNGKAYYLRGRVLRKSGKLQESNSDFHKAATLNYYG